jgi:hypothetical protein
MTERNFKNEIEKLKLEIQLKDTEIKEYLDKIETLEDTIMEIEVNISEKSDKVDTLLLINQIKHLEKYNRELKDKMGFLRLKNIRLKKELEESKNGYYSKLSLIKIVESESNSAESQNSIKNDSPMSKTQNFQKDSFNNIDLICPICKTQKTLKIPHNIINPSIYLTTINIPKELICEHSFQILIDKSFTVKKYQIENYELNKIELSNNKNFTAEILSKIRTFIDDREILGVAIFDDEWNVIFASIPSDSLFNLFNEINLRRETQIRDITKFYVELKNQQKYFLEFFEIGDISFILVLLFSQRVNFGMGTMLFKDVKDKLKKFFINHKEGLI